MRSNADERTRGRSDPTHEFMRILKTIWCPENSCSKDPNEYSRKPGYYKEKRPREGLKAGCKSLMRKISCKLRTSLPAELPMREAKGGRKKRWIAPERRA